MEFLHKSFTDCEEFIDAPTAESDGDRILGKTLILCFCSFIYTSTDCEDTDHSSLACRITDVSESCNDDENLDGILLTEANIPVASLDGKHPTELNVAQLKRWLACRNAPVSGKKPELIER